MFCNTFKIKCLNTELPLPSRQVSKVPPLVYTVPRTDRQNDKRQYLRAHYLSSSILVRNKVLPEKLLGGKT